MSHSDPGTPRWRALLALTLGVLCAHALLLTEGWPNWSARVPETPPVASPVVTATRDAPGEALTPPGPAPVAPVSVSSVRWIRPTPDTPAVAPQAERPRPPAPVRRPASPPSPPVTPIETPPETPAERPPEAPAEVAAPDIPPTETAPVAESPAEAPAPAALVDTQTAATPPEAGASDGPQLPPAHPPGNVDLSYDVTLNAKGLSYNAEAQLTWRLDGAGYSGEMAISAFLLGSRVQTSRGLIGPAGLMPERFSDRGRSNEKATHFDQAGQRIRYSSNAPDTPLLPGAQDRLSVFLQLSALLHTRPEAYLTGQTIALQVAGTGSAEVWPFQLGPLEDIQLPAGSLNTRRLTRAPRREFDSTVEVWLAPALQFLPVRIRVTEHNGDVADQQLRRLPRLVQ
jgi:hypothetical protein